MFILLTSLTGCGKFDSSAYIQAMLDSIYKNEHEEYASMTHRTMGTLKENYEEGINAEIETLISYMNIADYSSYVNETTRQNARDLFKSIYKQASYTVGEADEKGNVTIKIDPIDIYTVCKDELSSYNKSFYKRNDRGEFAKVDDEEFYSSYIQGAVDILKSHANKITYEAPVSVPVRVKPNSQAVYSIKESAFLEIDQNIIRYIE